MNEHPIIFSAVMVKAILAGHKTQTRRVIVPQPNIDDDGLPHIHKVGDVYLSKFSGYPLAIKYHKRLGMIGMPLKGYGYTGDYLWVREKGWERPERTGKMMREGADTWPRYMYDADDCDADQLRAWGWKRRPSIHMPRWASRITLEIMKVRVERVQDISVSDIKSEGTPGMICGRYQCERCNGQGRNITHPSGCPDCGGTGDNPHKYFMHLWNKINAERGFGWDTNPWVWAIEFKRHEVVK